MISLQRLLNTMDRFQTVYVTDEPFKVRDIDTALRTIRKTYNFPWNLKKSSIKVFDGVFEYPVDSDFKEIAYLDNSKNGYGNKARFVYTSIQQFYEDANNRNKLCELREGETKLLGIKYNLGNSSTLLSNAEDATKFTCSGDASNPVNDIVNFKEGNQSVRFTITSSAGVASVVNTIDTFSDANYKKKYQFKWIYLASVPTSITLRLRTDSSNYLYTNITTQFSGAPFKANQWNLIAQNLDTANEQGTFDYTNIASEEVVISDANTGTYFIDSSYLREWSLLDFYYYSKYNVSIDGLTAGQSYFMDSSEAYDPATNYLLGDDEFMDVVVFEALTLTLADKDNKGLKEDIQARRNDAWLSLFRRYPDMAPVIITNYYNLEEDYQYANINSGDSIIY